jgi:hypothetical protein
MSDGVRSPGFHVLAGLLLTLIVVIQGGAVLRTTSGTWDETVFLATALRAYRDADILPFVAQGAAPLPVLICYWLPALQSPSPVLEASSYQQLIWLARWSAIILIGVPLVLAVYGWAIRLYKRHFPAFMAAAIVALSPTIIAHASLATTDTCFVLTTLIALGALAVYVPRPSGWRVAVLAVTVGLAFAAKYTAVVLVPTVFLAIVSWPRQEEGIVPRVVRAVGVCAVVLLVSFMVAWGFHRFVFVRADVGAFLSSTYSVPAPIAGLLTQFEHNRAGHPAFLWGKSSSLGWWYYMPVALLLKSTPTELCVFGLAVCAFVTGWRTDTASFRVLRMAFFMSALALLFSYINIGVRYALLLYPLAVLGASRFLSGGLRTLRGQAAVALLVFQAASAVLIAPHYLSYFNWLSGGPANGYRYLADSNVDWGQDLPALKRTLKGVGAERPLVAYFGTAPLEAYGIDALKWSCNPAVESARPDWIAISATLLDGAYVQDDPFAKFRRIQPSARAAYSILLYSMDRAEVRGALAAASTTCHPWRQSPGDTGDSRPAGLSRS